ncbi:hypothetical protein MOQ_005068 [Trypanosoma cruzi marinkellei]|uniref:Uncharacterized protein n=1 Tax=Trypanosoma cruzi marinkellei TaxID=85056 RepID=K2M7X6_TRYCR|nr:hypothetical protein MOQ_005068 [Trypanosoma cruzi marinkellei]
MLHLCRPNNDVKHPWREALAFLRRRGLLVVLNSDWFIPSLLITFHCFYRIEEERGHPHLLRCRHLRICDALVMKENAGGVLHGRPGVARAVIPLGTIVVVSNKPWLTKTCDYESFCPVTAMTVAKSRDTESIPEICVILRAAVFQWVKQRTPLCRKKVLFVAPPSPKKEDTANQHTSQTCNSYKRFVFQDSGGHCMLFFVSTQTMYQNNNKKLKKHKQTYETNNQRKKKKISTPPLVKKKTKKDA